MERRREMKFTKKKTIIIALVISLIMIISYLTNSMVEGFKEGEEEIIEDNSENNETERNSLFVDCSVVYEESGEAYLLDSAGEKIAGPYEKIYSNDLKWMWDVACRYIDEGLIGYLSSDGSELTKPIYIEASKMRDGKARVREKTGGVYYINSSGERISADFVDAYEYENQGAYARVQLEDGTWGIINRNGELTNFKGADYIEPLPYVTTLGGAVVDGRAILFELNIESDDEITIVKKFEEFSYISEMYEGMFWLVATDEGRSGVIDGKGDIVIPAEYVSIDCGVIGDDKVEFVCHKPDGTYAVLIKKYHVFQ